MRLLQLRLSAPSTYRFYFLFFVCVDGSNRPATFKAALLYRFREIGVKLSVEDSDCARPSSISWLERGVRNSVVVHDGEESAWPLTVVGGPTVMPGSVGTVFLPHLEDTDGANCAPPA